MGHLLLLFWHALLVSVFFAFLWRKPMRERRVLFLKTFLIMVAGGLLLGGLPARSPRGRAEVADVDSRSEVREVWSAPRGSGAGCVRGHDHMGRIDRG